MDLAHPYHAICPTLDGAVLSTLAGTSRPLSGREVARLAGRGSHSGTLDVLNRLTEQGVVDRQEAGRALLYTLNRDHLAVPAVTAMASIRLRLIESLRDALKGWSISPVHAWLFGSMARGEGDTHSDIDIFLVRPSTVVDPDSGPWDDQVDQLSNAVRRWTGNHAGIVQVSAGEFSRLAREGSPVIGELAADAIALSGLPVKDALESAK